MRKLLRVLPVLLVLVSGMAFAGVEDPVTPLPDYTKAPFTKLDEGTGIADLHEDEGRLPAERHATATEPKPGASMVMVFKGQDTKPKYAEWTYVNDDGSFTTRYYVRKGEKWEREQPPKK